ncbi:MAG: iron ABC transporter permease [Gammaproteobacteria bacterium]
MRVMPFAGLLLVTAAIAVISLLTGSADVGWQDLWLLLTGETEPFVRQVIMELRLPRTLNGFLVGALLALAGVLMQVLLRNPLAEPYILGVSGGAAAGALLVVLVTGSQLWLGGGAMTGALLSILLVFMLAHGRGEWQPLRLLLTGVVLAAGWGALVSFLLVISPLQSLRSMLFWLMGDLSQSGSLVWPGLVLFIGLLLALVLARSLNLLLRGDREAAALGVAVRPVRGMLYVISALLTATAVVQAGTIGFVGLVVPHLLRLWLGADHRLLIPASVLAGGSLVMLADLLARSLLAPQQLPVGVLTAFIGVPLFLFLLQRQAGAQRP